MWIPILVRRRLYIGPWPTFRLALLNNDSCANERLSPELVSTQARLATYSESTEGCLAEPFVRLNNNQFLGRCFVKHLRHHSSPESADSAGLNYILCQEIDELSLEMSVWCLSNHSYIYFCNRMCASLISYIENNVLALGVKGLTYRMIAWQK